MCGIAGSWTFTPRWSAEEQRQTMVTMTRQLRHRGPDDEGFWFDAAAGLAFGHRRLTVVGPGKGGHQPRVSTAPPCVLVFNGELYNHRELRRELTAQGRPCCGNGDAEVMLQALATWGVERALERFEGMFAFAFWEGRSRTLHLVRDRLGEKPLYYGSWPGVFVFASELKAIRVHPGWTRGLDPSAVAEYFRYGTVGGSLTIDAGIQSLPAGARLVVRDGVPSEPILWWSSAAAMRRAALNPFRGDAAEAVERLEDLLLESLRLRLQADVPVGAFLSGGLDSASLVLLAARRLGQSLPTFTISSPDPGTDEGPAAAQLARLAGGEHSIRRVDPSDVLATIPSLPAVFDQPFGDPSAIPTLAVAALARESVTVVLAGDGGDEALGGYDRYRQAVRLRRIASLLPAPARRLSGHLLGSLASPRLRNAGSWLREGFPLSIHWHLLAHWKEPSPLIPELASFWRASARRTELDDGLTFRQQLLHLDTTTVLPDALLVKVDRSSMRFGLEVRLPFLAPSVLAFCHRLPASLLWQNGSSKWILREVLSRHVPASLLPGSKRGFSLPLGPWLRQGLRPWAESLLSRDALSSSGLLEVAPIRRCWQEHLEGKRFRTRAIWNVLMFQAWDQARRAEH